MVISMDQFGAQGSFATFDPFKVAGPSSMVFTLQCRSCGFEPDNAVTAPKCCPKCMGKSWERFARPGSILTNADRY